MKPKRVILIRHGQSEGNVNKQVYTNKPDYALNLTEEGKTQAFLAGIELKKIIGDESITFYTSPFYRTRQTFEGVRLQFPWAGTREDPRLREQEWGHLRDLDLTAKMEEYRENYGHFFYRFNDGESCADVYDRVSDFLDTLFRDFQKPTFSDNVGIIGHGMTNRVILMRWFHWSVEYFESIRNPKNCEMFILERQDNDKYKLTTPLRFYSKPTRKF